MYQEESQRNNLQGNISLDGEVEVSEDLSVKSLMRTRLQVHVFNVAKGVHSVIPRR